MKKKFLISIYLIILLSGCAGEILSPAPLSETTPTPFPMLEHELPQPPKSPYFEQSREWPALCTHKDALFEITQEDITLLISNWHLQEGSACNGENGTALFINGIYVFYTSNTYLADECSIYTRALAGRTVGVADLRTDAYGEFWNSNDFHIFDMETLEAIDVPVGREEIYRVRHNEEVGLLDMSAFPTSALVEDCTYKALPPSARLDPYFERITYCVTSLQGEDTLQISIGMSYPYGQVKMIYTYENGAFVLTEIRTDNDDAEPVYEPIEGKPLEARNRQPGDGLLPEAAEAGAELLFCGERMDFLPGVQMDESRDDVSLALRRDGKDTYMSIVFYSNEAIYIRNPVTGERELNPKRKAYFYNLTTLERTDWSLDADAWWDTLEYIE